MNNFRPYFLLTFHRASPFNCNETRLVLPISLLDGKLKLHFLSKALFVPGNSLSLLRSKQIFLKTLKSSQQLINIQSCKSSQNYPQPDDVMCWIESLIFDNILNLNQTMKGIREELHKREKTPPFIWLDPFYFSRLEQRDPKTFIIPFIADVRSFLEVAFFIRSTNYTIRWLHRGKRSGRQTAYPRVSTLNFSASNRCSSVNTRALLRHNVESRGIVRKPRNVCLPAVLRHAARKMNEETRKRKSERWRKFARCCDI